MLENTKHKTPSCGSDPLSEGMSTMTTVKLTISLSSLPQPEPVVVTAQPVTANVQPTVAPVSVAAYPAMQKVGVVVAQPASTPTL